MKNLLIKALILIMAISLCAAVFTGCGPKKKTIIIYSSAEDYRNENARKMLVEKFPEYTIRLEEKDTGTLASKLIAEGKKTDADIIMELETSYLEKISDNLAELKDVDFSVYCEELIPASHKYVPWNKLSGGIIINEDALKSKGVPVPTSYDDLLKSEYKGLISMPNPKSSGTGYVFLLNLVNERGESAAIEYFNKLAENISGQGFTTSGSGPVNALISGEASIGLGMTFQAVTKINDGHKFTILFFDEGAPYTTYSSAVIEGRQYDEDVMKVFNYILSDVTPKDKELYSPEKIYKDRDYKITNYPENIPYGNMDGIRDNKFKENLLDKWNH